MDQFSYVLNFKHLASLNVFEALTKHSATVKNTKGTLFDVIYILSDRYHEVNQVATSSWRVYIYIYHIACFAMAGQELPSKKASCFQSVQSIQERECPNHSPSLARGVLPKESCEDCEVAKVCRTPLVLFA